MLNLTKKNEFMNQKQQMEHPLMNFIMKMVYVFKKIVK